MTLLAAELVALMLDGLGSPPVAAAGRTAAAIDIPLLGVALVGIAIMRAWRTRGVDEDPREHGLSLNEPDFVRDDPGDAAPEQGTVERCVKRELGRQREHQPDQVEVL